ncbi:uncharacterized protein LOC143259586 isoform X5 [Megalopta genalis]|uniref:uncharacterized protein LOC143259586 isoform X5 n=1 Tax=Megalopta genalis TaxID=115081 RepID=UPI003FD49246
MDVFRKNYSTYYSILSLAGLWPYDESLIGKLQRVVLSLLTLLCIVIQISTLKLVELSLSNIITLLSYTFPLLLYFLRYVGFVVNFPVIRSVFENVERDCKTLENSVEVDMLLKHMAEARRIIQAYVVMSCLVAAYVTVSILLPTLLRSKLQLHYLHMFGFFYTEGGQQIDRVCVHLVLVSVMGQITLAGTESSLAVFSAYFCGLFDIASYRIRGAVNKMVNSVTLELIDIQSAIEVHQRALELAGSDSHEKHDALVFSSDRNGCRLVRRQFIPYRSADVLQIDRNLFRRIRFLTFAQFRTETNYVYITPNEMHRNNKPQHFVSIQPL